MLKIFKGNTDRYSVIGYNFEPKFTARYVRIHPLSWYGHISMRMQCYGCVGKKVILEQLCKKPSGLFIYCAPSFQAQLL